MLIVQMCVSYAHVNLCHSFVSTWCQGLAATSCCGSSLTFLFTFLFENTAILYSEGNYSDITNVCKNRSHDVTIHPDGYK